MDGGFTRVIANGTVAAPYGTFRAHVVVAGERIAAFSSDDGVGTTCCSIWRTCGASARSAGRPGGQRALVIRWARSQQAR